MVFSNLFFLFAAQFDLLFSGEKHPCEKRDINCFFALFLCLGRAEIRAAAGRYGADQLDLWLDD